MAIAFNRSIEDINFFNAYQYLDDYLTGREHKMKQSTHIQFPQEIETQKLIRLYLDAYLYDGILSSEGTARAIANNYLHNLLVMMYKK